MAEMGVIDLEGLGVSAEESDGTIEIEEYRYDFSAPGDGVLLKYPTYPQGIYMYLESNIGFSINNIF